MINANLRILIQSVEDSENRTKPVMPECTMKNTTLCSNMSVTIMEDMTTQNKAGVSVVIQAPDGHYYTAFLTEEIMNGLVSAYKGAIERFNS